MVVVAIQPVNNNVSELLKVYFAVDYLQQAETRMVHISSLYGTLVP